LAEARLCVGDLLVRERYLTAEQLKQAVAIQQAQLMYMPLGQVCVEMKFISQANLDNLLIAHQKHILLGELLTNLELITEEQLQEALQE
jgi:type IV pilus assembly protein PilB